MREIASRRKQGLDDSGSRKGCGRFSVQEEAGNQEFYVPEGTAVTDRNVLIEMIIYVEWQLFQGVSNIGGRASCQDDRETFEIMRRSQFLTWNTECLDAWLRDLCEAVKEGRNPVAEKYAWMMESTDPGGFLKVREQLPERSSAKLDLISRIGEIHLAWNEECKRKYQGIYRGARPVHASEDGAGMTSSETYWKGELSTYSEKTLDAYYRYAAFLRREGRNLCEEILENTVNAYGYATIEEAEP